jgi:hypothetical protein
MHNEWLCNPIEVEPSPPTSMATDTCTAIGKIYKGCRCPPHQEIYSDWPTQDAELTISKCMRICVYCGKDFSFAAELRKHMRRKYTKRNLTVNLEIRGKWSNFTPSWTRIGPLTSWTETRVTWNQSLTYGTNATQPA